eukprot:SAG25_NODE_9816_length_357_cov_0.593023_1_plen_34_part_10
MRTELIYTQPWMQACIPRLTNDAAHLYDGSNASD